MFLGKADEEFKLLLTNGLMMLLSFNGFVPGANMSLMPIVKAGTIIKGQDLIEVKNGAILVKNGVISHIYDHVWEAEAPAGTVIMDVWEINIILL